MIDEQERGRQLALTNAKQHALFDINNMQFTRIGMRFTGKVEFDDWEQMFRMLHFTEEGVQFGLGDMILKGEADYGEEYSQVLEATNRSYSALTGYKYVAKAIPYEERRAGVEWSKHAAVAPLMKAAPEKAREILAIAQETDTSLREVKHMVRDAFAELDNGVGEHDEDGHGRTEDDDARDSGTRAMQVASNGHGDPTQPIARAEWLDELLDIVLEIARANDYDETLKAGFRAAQWAEGHGFILEGDE